MNVILNYAPQLGFTVIENGTEKLNPNGWFMNLVKKYGYPNQPVIYLGTDDKQRHEIQISVNLFEKFKTDELFVLKAEKLRRLRSGHNLWIEFLTSPLINNFDNDLDS